MKTDIGIWEIDPTSRAGTKLRLTERVETEKMLEAVLVANPDMLMSGLTLVGRQVPVETGFIDLLGIDEDGRLVFSWLKREKLTRAAVAQVLDYCTYLETLSDSEIATLLAERSGKDGIKRIGDFEEWYGRHGGEPTGRSGWSWSVSVSTRAPTDWCPTWRTGHRHPAGDFPRLRSRRWDAVGQAGTGCGRSSYVVRQSATRARPESEGHRARSGGDWAGRTRVAGLQCSDVLHEIRHHLPATDDHPAR